MPLKELKFERVDDGFFIAEEDLKLRGFGDLTGYQQSGIKILGLLIPFHKDLFFLAEKYVSNLKDSLNQRKFNFY